MRAYEIQTYQDGRWKIDSVFDDRELALYEARRVDAGNRYSSVRVVEETFDESSQNSLTRTIFRGGRTEKQSSKADSKSDAPAPPRVPAGRNGSKNRVRHGSAKPRARKKGGFISPLLILSILVVAGLAGLFGLQRLFSIG